jgi:hypothetical protein
VIDFILLGSVSGIVPIGSSSDVPTLLEDESFRPALFGPWRAWPHGRSDLHLIHVLPFSSPATARFPSVRRRLHPIRE